MGPLRTSFVVHLLTEIKHTRTLTNASVKVSDSGFGDIVNPKIKQDDM